jgi:mycothiol S-conjugate amidase
MDSLLFDASGGQGVTMLVVRPHPDDESTATGGMLAYYHARGVRTGVVICTGGEEGEIRDPDLDPVADIPHLREIRTREVRDACVTLGVTTLWMLGYRDSGMPGMPANQHAAAFCQADPIEATGRLVRIIRALRPLVMVTEPPGGLYAHPDHITCHRVSVDAFHAAGDARAYPDAGPPWQVARLYAVMQIDDGQWEALRPELTAAGIDTAFLGRRRSRDRSPGPETATVALDVRPYTEIQRQALLAHRTQIPPESFAVRLPADLRRRAFATAYFLRLHPPAVPGEHEPDLLNGLAVTTGTECSNQAG